VSEIGNWSGCVTEREKEGKEGRSANEIKFLHAPQFDDSGVCLIGKGKNWLEIKVCLLVSPFPSRLVLK